MYRGRFDPAAASPPSPRPSVGRSMVSRTAVWMTGLAFCLGLVLGLLCHLPGVSSPQDGGRHPRAAGARLLLALDASNAGKTAPQHDSKDGNKLSEVGDNSREYHTSVVVSTRKNVKHIYDISHAMNNKQVAGSDLSWTDLSVAKGQQPAVRANLPNMLSVNGRDKEPGNAVPDQRPHILSHTGGAEGGGQPRQDTPATGNSTAPSTSVNRPQDGSQNNSTGSLVDGIYWSNELDMFTPRGFTQEFRRNWRKTVENAKVIGLAEGCGRMQNRQLLFDDGGKACGRYRINQDQIQGEVYSYYLSRLLGMENVPPPVLLLPQARESRWSQVTRGLIGAQWHPQRPVIVTPWLDHLLPAFIPPPLRPDNRSLQPPDIGVPSHRLSHPDTMRTLTDLVQWSDLIVFDYITANLDRVVNNMFNKQWNPDMMNSPTHNLEQNSQSQSLVFLDNESGLFHSYRLLDKYGKYHDSLLHSLCIFKRGTADKIRTLHQQGSVGKDLHNLIQKEEPLYSHVPSIPQRNIQTLQQRIANVFHQIQHCESKYGSNR